MISSVVRVFLVLFLVLSVAALRPTPTVAQEVAAPGAELPTNMQVSALLQPSVALMLRNSATFARQCASIGAAHHVRVVVTATSAPRLSTGPRARGIITRHVYGAIRAVIEVPVTEDHVELIAHEIEHVIEQIEGLNLAALARTGGHDVVEVYDGVFETARAKAAGLAVAYESRGGTDPIATTASKRLTHVLRAIGARASHRPHPTLLLRR